jgi:1,4-dihydroxy-2-naphthoyl-CoA hydrolase
VTQPQTYRSPFDDLVGVRVVEATTERVVAEVEVREDLHQPSGILHGGVYATVAETVASVGANVWLAERAIAVGVSNHTDFLRSMRGGTLRAEATPLQRGRTLQLWNVAMTDEQGRLLAHGKVKLMNLEGGPQPSGD